MIYAGIFIVLKGSTLEKALKNLKSLIAQKQTNLTKFLSYFEQYKNGHCNKEELSLVRLNNRTWIFGYIEKLNVKKINHLTPKNVTFSEKQIEWLNIVTYDIFGIQNQIVNIGLISMNKKSKVGYKKVLIKSQYDVSHIKYERDWQWYEENGNDMNSSEMQFIIENEGLVRS